MKLVDGFSPLTFEDDDAPEHATAGDTPGTDAVREACRDLDRLHAEDAIMALPGATPKTPDVFPHSPECEARLLAAAQYIRQAVEELQLAKEGK